MKAKSIVLIFLLCFISSRLFAGPVEEMHNSFAKGFTAAKNRDKDGAINAFNTAGQYAEQARNWQGLLDTANALAMMNVPQDALPFLQKAAAMAENEKDWRAAVATAYCLASLPDSIKQTAAAVDLFRKASTLAASKGDWIGVTEAANGLINMNQIDIAVPLIQNAENIVSLDQSFEGSRAVAKLYDRVNLPDAASRIRQAGEDWAISSGDTVPTPPPG
ncbi:MAG: hypothetical protein P9M03_05115, partial [Candidatus Theseobacter exili]|nr:hypothetical protein [Candidatus Theseobacter exili]